MQRALSVRLTVSSSVLALTALVACASSGGRSAFDDAPPPPPGNASSGGMSGGTSSSGGGSSTPGGGLGGPTETPPIDDMRDPVDCQEAAAQKSYVGCDYWPTITPNPVWSIFDFAVVVANTGKNEATVQVTGPNDTDKKVVVPPGELRKIYLPWVDDLKGPEFNECTAVKASAASAVVSSGAYHLVSSSPVIVYQFNALEYRGDGGEAPGGGPKDWSQCPGTTTGCRQSQYTPPVKLGCYSFSNDASLLLPSTAMTNSYRVMGHNGTSVSNIADIGMIPSVLSVTSTQADTQVTVQLSSKASIVASSNGDTVAKTDGGQTLSFRLPGAGDVVQLVTENGVDYDFSGSVVTSTKPVQVITSVPCISIPSNKAACDHVEESVLPVETLGRQYLVIPPTGPKGTPVAHEVRIYGNKDGTTLAYEPEKPEGCPDTIAAGEVVDCGLVDRPFEVTANNELGVMTFLLGASVYDKSGKDRRGDPSESFVPAVEQFRTSYVLLAPTDYPVLYADVTATVDAAVELDGAPVTAPWTMIADGPYGFFRVDLTRSGKDGAHTLKANKPIGVQVVGFGDNTSFQYPAGLNLKIISPPLTTK
jgi:hypothetical protein